MPTLLVNNLLNKDFTYLFSGFHQENLDIVSVDGTGDELPSEPERFDSIILSGSEESILRDSPWIDRQMEFVRKAAEREIPVLGVCFGHQLIARALYGRKTVGKCREHEIGWLDVTLSGPGENDPLFRDIPGKFHLFHSHFDEVLPVSEDIMILAGSEKCRVQAMRIWDTHVYGIQFHPEISLADGIRHLSEIKPLFPHLMDDIDQALRKPVDSGVSGKLLANFYKFGNIAAGT